MYPSVWTPHMTVAAIIEQRECLADAVIREVLEETGVQFVPEHLVGIYRWVNPCNDETHLRVAFTGSVADIDRLRAHRARLRNPLVLEFLDDHRRGRHYPIEILRDFG